MKTFQKLAAAFLLVCLACQSLPQAELKAGTEIPLMLLTELSSGGSGQGSEVAFMVSQDIKAEDGRVLVPRGAIAYGRVSWSRSAGAISKFLNEPARLAITIDRTVTSDGATVFLEATKTKEKEPFHFTGENTGIERASDELEKVLADEASKKALERMLGGLTGADMGDKDIIAALAGRLNLSNMKQLAETNSLKDLVGVFKGIATGEVTRVATGHAVLVIDAISELAGLRKSVGDRISGLFKGRNIKAYPGTPVTAYVAEKKMVDAPSAK